MASTCPLIPPAPIVHSRPLPTWRAVGALLTNLLTVFSEDDFDCLISRSTFLGRLTVSLNDPAAARHVLTTARSKYRRPLAVVRPIRWLAGEGLFLAEGEAWRSQRRMLAPTFGPGQLSALLPHFQAAGRAMLTRLGGLREAELSTTFTDAALDSLLRALFSMPADAQGRDLAAMTRRYIEGVGRPRLTDALARREQGMSFLNGGRRRFRAEYHKAVLAIIEGRQAPRDGTASHDMLDLLLAGRDPETGQPLSLEQIRDEIATFIFAGFETTSRLLFWAAYLLALDQGEQALVHEEIASFPPERIEALGDLEKWPRLRRVLLETLRLYPPVPLLLREAVEEDEVMGETIVPGTLVTISPWTMHRHKKLWSNPTAFMPDRFSEQRQPWTQGPFMPFGGGPRICIGAGFAMAEAQILLAMLLAKCRIGMVGPRPVVPIGRVTTVPDHEPRFALDHWAPQAFG